MILHPISDSDGLSTAERDLVRLEERVCEDRGNLLLPTASRGQNGRSSPFDRHSACRLDSVEFFAGPSIRDRSVCEAVVGEGEDLWGVVHGASNREEVESGD